MTARLLKVIMQPVYVVEEDGELIEVPVQPIQMPASDFKALNAETWAKQGAAAVDQQVAPVVDGD